MNKKPAPTFQCQLCGKIKERRLMKTKDGKHSSYDKGQKFCSKECGWKGRSRRPINPEGYMHSSGYRRVHLPNGGKALKQRLVMSKHLGRPLTKFESVHHKNGDRLDNSLSNLELWSRYQPRGQRVVDKVQFAIEILTLYPEFAKSAGYELRKIEHIIADSPSAAEIH
jgi:hypothetical protein